jgi:hypothetical protein
VLPVPPDEDKAVSVFKSAAALLLGLAPEDFMNVTAGPAMRKIRSAASGNNEVIASAIRFCSDSLVHRNVDHHHQHSPDAKVAPSSQPINYWDPRKSGICASMNSLVTFAQAAFFDGMKDKQKFMSLDAGNGVELNEKRQLVRRQKTEVGDEPDVDDPEVAATLAAGSDEVEEEERDHPDRALRDLDDAPVTEEEIEERMATLANASEDKNSLKGEELRGVLQSMAGIPPGSKGLSISDVHNLRALNLKSANRTDARLLQVLVDDTSPMPMDSDDREQHMRSMVGTLVAGPIFDKLKARPEMGATVDTITEVGKLWDPATSFFHEHCPELLAHVLPLLDAPHKAAIGKIAPKAFEALMFHSEEFAGEYTQEAAQSTLDLSGMERSDFPTQRETDNAVKALRIARLSRNRSTPERLMSADRPDREFLQIVIGNNKGLSSPTTDRSHFMKDLKVGAAVYVASRVQQLFPDTKPQLDAWSEAHNVDPVGEEGWKRLLKDVRTGKEPKELASAARLTRVAREWDPSKNFIFEEVGAAVNHLYDEGLIHEDELGDFTLVPEDEPQPEPKKEIHDASTSHAEAVAHAKRRVKSLSAPAVQCELFGS